MQRKLKLFLKNFRLIVKKSKKNLLFNRNKWTNSSDKSIDYPESSIKIKQNGDNSSVF